MKLFPNGKETVRIAAKLAVDALALLVTGGVAYLLSELVLPGIFSSRVNFFLFYLTFGSIALFAILSWSRYRSSAPEDFPKKTATDSLPKSGIAALVVFATIFLFWGEKKLPVTNIVFGALATAAILLVLFSDAFSSETEDRR